MRVIASRQHSIVKTFRAIARGSQSHLLLDGWHLLTDAVRANVIVETIAVAGEPRASDARVLERARTSGADVIAVSAKVIEALSPVRSASSVVAIARRPNVPASALLSPSPALVLAIAGVQDPGNVGAAIRSAAGGGATGVACDGGSADPFGWKALRASMGSAFHVPVLRVADMNASVARWRASGLAILAATARGGRSIYDVDWRRPTAILMGGEGAGLPASLADAADSRVSIPMRPPVESLNVAVAAALMVFEAQRQR
ncbi:MAG: TrmH family RNA methyltransferase [Vicinamibacterales bacterium]